MSGRPRFTVVSSAELAAAGTWSARDFLAAGGLSCCLCGLTPANVHVRGRTNPSSALLEQVDVHPAPEHPLARPPAPRFRCRNREACDRRRRLVGRGKESRQRLEEYLGAEDH